MKLEFGKSFIYIKRTKGLKLNPGGPQKYLILKVI